MASKLYCSATSGCAGIAILLGTQAHCRQQQYLGMNPAVSFYCYASNNTYTVPSGSDLLITDISAGDYLVIRADGTTIWTHYGNYSNTSKHHALSTGFTAPSGSVVSCSSGSGYLAGYLIKS